MKQRLAASLGALALVAGSYGAATSQSMSAGSATPMSDGAFAAAAQRSNDDEIAASRTVLRTTKNAAVRAFAEEMIQDHSSADVSLQALARTAHVTLPGAERVEHMRDSARPSLSDSAYIQTQIDGHRKALAMVSSYSTSGANADLKNYASTQVPVVTKHLTEAQSLAGSMPMTRLSPSAAASGAAAQDHPMTGVGGLPASPSPSTPVSPSTSASGSPSARATSIPGAAATQH